jgi:hypothetical protein
MAGITLAESEAKLVLWMEADDKVASGQSYSIGGRSLSRADAKMIQENIKFWDRKVKELSDGGIKVIAVTPVG